MRLMPRPSAASAPGAWTVPAVIVAFLVAGAAPVSAQWQPDGAAVCTAAGAQVGPVAVPDGSNGVIVLWEDDRAVPTRVRAQRLNSAGVAQWAADGVEISSLAGAQTAPVATTDAVGGVIIAWEQDAARKRQSTSTRSGSTAAGTRLWGANGAVVSAPTGNQWKPKIVSDGRALITTTPGAIIAFEDTRLDAGDLYVTALDQAGVLRWTTFAAVAPGRQGPATMVTDGSGITISNPKGVILAWRDERVDPGQGDVYAQRVNSLGSPQWGAGGTIVCSGGALSDAPALLQVSGGTAIVGWARFRGSPRGEIDIHVDRVGGAGSWAVNGVVACGVDGQQTDPVLARDAALGAIVTWRDQRDFLNPRVYSQRIDQNGAARWAAGGVPMGGDRAPEGPPAVATSSAGCVIAWDDRRYGTRDLFAQRVDSTGTRFWNPWGVPVTRAAFDQYEHVAISDGANSAIVVWRDYRNGEADIYAQRLFDGGIVDVADPAALPSAGVRLGAAVPNPVRSGCALALDLPAPSRVDAEVLDVAGRRVRVLRAGESLPAGRSTLTWDGRDDRGATVAAGLYFVRVAAGAAVVAQRVVVVSP